MGQLPLNSFYESTYKASLNSGLYFAPDILRLSLAVRCIGLVVKTIEDRIRERPSRLYGSAGIRKVRLVNDQ